MSHPQRQHYAPLTVQPARMAEPVKTEAHTKMLALCERLAAGELMKDLAPEYFGSSSSLFRAMDRHPELRRMYDAARVLQAHHWAEDALDCINSEPDTQRAKLKSEVRRWLASKLAPKDYGEALNLQVTEQLDIRGIVEEMNRRAHLAKLTSLPKVIDAEVIPPDPEPPGLLR